MGNGFGEAQNILGHTCFEEDIVNKDEQKRLTDAAMTIKDYCKSRNSLSEPCTGCVFSKNRDCLLTNDWPENWELKGRPTYREVFLKAFSKARLRPGNCGACRDIVFKGFAEPCSGRTCEDCWNEIAPEEYQKKDG